MKASHNHRDVSDLTLQPASLQNIALATALLDYPHNILEDINQFMNKYYNINLFIQL